MKKIESILIAGQRFSSRVEALESYCIKKIPVVGVYAFPSPLASHGKARWTIYKDSSATQEKLLSGIRVPSLVWQWLFLPWIFIWIILRGFFLARNAQPKWDCFVGVALVSTLMGLFLRHWGLVRRVIYYNLDYYPPGGDILNRLAIFCFNHLDRWAVEQCDEHWVICDRIPEAREIFSGLRSTDYHWQEVPLGFDSSFICHPEKDSFDRYSLGFVGCLSENQGLQKIFECLPVLKNQFPNIKLHIIGQGPYEQSLRQQAEQLGILSSIIFHGFVANDHEMQLILSRCAVGLALWTGTEGDYSRYADPGKPKLYVLSGIPVLITPIPKIAETLELEGAGCTVPYEKESIVNKLKKILGDESLIKEMRKKSRAFSLKHCLAHPYFEKAFQKIPFSL